MTPVRTPLVNTHRRILTILNVLHLAFSATAVRLILATPVSAASRAYSHDHQHPHSSQSTATSAQATSSYSPPCTFPSYPYIPWESDRLRLIHIPQTQTRQNHSNPYLTLPPRAARSEPDGRQSRPRSRPRRPPAASLRWLAGPVRLCAELHLVAWGVRQSGSCGIGVVGRGRGLWTARWLVRGRGRGGAVFRLCVERDGDDEVSVKYY